MTYDEQLASAAADYWDEHNDPDGGDEPDWYAPIAQAYASLRVAQLAHGDQSPQARAARVEIERAWALADGVQEQDAA